MIVHDYWVLGPVENQSRDAMSVTQSPGRVCQVTMVRDAKPPDAATEAGEQDSPKPTPL